MPQSSAGDDIRVACPASVDTRSSQKDDGKGGGVRYTAYSSWLPRNIHLVFAAALLSNNSFWPNCSFLCKLLCSWNLAVKTSCSSRASTSCPLLAPAWSRGRHWRAERSRVNPSSLWTTTPGCSPACVPGCLSKSLQEARRSS